MVCPKIHPLIIIGLATFELCKFEDTSFRSHIEMHAWMQASMDEMRSFIALVPLTLRAFEPNWSRLADWCMIGILAEDRQSDKKDCVCSVVSLKRKQIL